MARWPIAALTRLRIWINRLLGHGEDGDHLAHEIQWERHRLFMTEVRSRMTAGAVVSYTTGLFFIDSAPALNLWIWFGVTTFVSLNCLLIIGYYYRHQVDELPDPSDMAGLKRIRYWHWANVYMAFIWGVLWALAPALFFPDASLVQLFILILLVVINASMPSVTLGVYPDLYLTFITLVMVSFGIALADIELEGTEMHKYLAPFMWAFLLAYSIATSRTQIDAIRTRLELRNSRQQLEKAGQVKTRFLAAASHDIRQPLQAANMYWATMKPAEFSDTQASLHERLGESLKATSELLNHLLDVSRLDAGVEQPHTEVVDMAVLLGELKVVFTPLAAQKGLQLTIECPPNSWVCCDRNMTLQIFKNLLANAVQYTLAGFVRVQVERHQQRLDIRVEDSGKGIAPEQQQAVFEEFVQLDNPGRQRSLGLGLGLSIVQRLCALQQIPLKLTSEPGKGSCFQLSLELQQRPSGSGLPVDEALAPALGGMKILLIDDHEDILDSLSTLLVSWDCDVWIANGLASARDQLQQSACQPELVISDDMLGNHDRIEQVLALLDEQLPERPTVIVMTGNTDAERIRQLHAIGCPVLHKPIGISELTAVLNDSCKSAVGVC